MAHTLFGSFTLSGAGCINGPIKGAHASKFLLKISIPLIIDITVIRILSL